MRATAILLAEPAFFDDEKERAASQAARKGLGKRTAMGQLQQLNTKRSRSSAVGAQTTDRNIVDKPAGLQCEKAMDDFVNAESHLEKCCHKIVNNHFGNVNLHKLLSPIRMIIFSQHSSTSHCSLLLSMLHPL